MRQTNSSSRRQHRWRRKALAYVVGVAISTSLVTVAVVASKSIVLWLPWWYFSFFLLLCFGPGVAAAWWISRSRQSLLVVPLASIVILYSLYTYFFVIERPADYTLTPLSSATALAQATAAAKPPPRVTVAGVLPVRRGIVEKVAFSPDGRIVAVGTSEGEVHLWEFSTKKEIRTLRDESGSESRALWLKALAFSPDGRLLAFGVLNTASVFGVQWGKLVKALQDGDRPNEQEVGSLAFSPDGAALTIAYYGRNRNNPTTKLRIYNARNFSPLCESPGQAAPGDMQVAYNPDGGTLAWAGPEGVVRVLDGRTCAEVRTLSTSGVPIEAIAYSPDGKALATSGYAGKGGKVQLLDALTGTQVLAIPTENRNSSISQGLAISPDGRLLAKVGGTRNVEVWSLPGGSPIPVVNPYDNAMDSIAFSPDSKSLVTGAPFGGAAVLWNVEVP